jgi:hypothetical protein
VFILADRFPPWTTPLRCLILAILLLAFAPHDLHAEAQRNTKAFTRFPILLGGILNDTLPFDVPFILWGDIDSRMTKELDRAYVVVWMAELPGSSGCQETALKTYRQIVRVDAMKWTEPDYTRRGETAPTDADAANRRQFEVLIPPLKPKRNYCFLFQVGPGQPATPQQAARLSAALLPAYEAFINTAGVIDELASAQAAEDLRQAIIRAMMAAVPFGGVTAQPGTVFDPAAKQTSVLGAFAQLWARVQTEHRRVVEGARRLQDFSANSTNAVTLQEWRGWLQNDALRRLPAVIQQHQAAIQAGTPTFAVSDNDLAALKVLLSLSDSDLQRIIKGLPPGDPEEPLAQLSAADRSVSDTPPADLANEPCPVVSPLSQRCRTIDLYRDALRRAESIVRAAGTIAAPPEAATVGKASSNLVNDIQQTEGDLTETRMDILNIQRAVNKRRVEMEAHVRALDTLIVTDFFTLATTQGSFATRKTWYVSADLGLAIAPTINEVFPYVGSNIYFRPVNTEAPPGSIGTRLSLLIGFSWTNNIIEPGERAALYGESASLFLGAGLRLTDFLKVSGGLLLFKGLDPNPTVNRDEIEFTPFISLSGDFDIAKILGGIFKNDAQPPAIGSGTPPK